MLFLLLHILFLLLVILYASRTSFVGEIELYSDDNFQIIAETPVGTTIDFQTDSFDTITISERTFRCIELRTQDDKSVLIDEDFPNDTVYTFSSTKIHFQSTPYVKSKLSGVFLFIITNTPALKLYLSLILLGVLFFLFQFLFLKKKRSLYKIRYFRFLLKRKSAKREIKKPVLNRIQFILVVVGLIAIIPASYLRLGQYPFSQGSEERRRALVSLEMKIQHEYLKPTVCGEPYFNKPPLFNWFLIPFVDKDNVEFNTRAISVSFLLLAACIVIALLKKSRGLRHALLVSFMFLSSTYIVTEFSMILNLDTFFALLLIPLFYLNFRLANKGKFYAMFIIGYFLTSLAFMTKGFPALWFQGVSVILALYFTKNLRKLISFQHLCGILSFLILPLLYFTLQAELIDSKLYINQLIKETLIANNFSFSDIVLHFFAFPFLNILAYLPMAILLPALLLRRNIILILKNKEISYLLFMCFIGCSVFAISPYYPRYYCLMFVPLLFDVIIFLLPQMHNLKIKEKTGAIVWIIVFSIFALPLFRFDNIEIILIIIAVSVLIWATNKIRLYIIIIASLVLITVKLTYPLHELKNEKFGYETKEQCREIVSSNKDTELYIQKGSKKINYVSIFYLTYFSGEVVHYSQPEINPDALYITDFENLPDNATVLDTIEQTFWEYDENKRLKG
ncbi:MAG: hypothetical protein PF448_11040, partial [Bacteroidales bacterium]|nr:hypothetical protein [Bacteroidales bacterium]